MLNTSNKLCRCVVELLTRHGVRQVFASPGSRNAPLLVAVSRSGQLNADIVVDERSSGFMALGYSLISREPVALICTSGTALLNYGPAIAEAYYRRIPLIIISADRPKQWIGQDDSQTLIQPGAFTNYVKRSYDIAASASEEELWYANRVINDALLSAVSGRVGPVHINLQLREPLNEMEIVDDEPFHVVRKIDIIRAKPSIEVSQARNLGKIIASPEKVMIICGFMNPDKALNKALRKLSRLPNIVVLTETVSNLHGPDEFVDCIDSTLASIREEDKVAMRPDYVISLGGAIVSRHVKEFLRTTKLKGHWHVGEMDDTIDCFKQLTLRIELDPAMFFQQLAAAMQPHQAECDYSLKWRVTAMRARSLVNSYVSKVAWSDMKAFNTLIPMIPRRWNVQYSNGTSIRYAQIFGWHQYHRCDCNRGVSGIDGSTSTAVGSSIAYKNDVTLLVSGDMSAIYDVGALTSGCIPSRFKMIVINNDGGGIFRFIKSTAKMDIRESMLAVSGIPSIKPFASAAGFKVFSADNESELRTAFDEFASVADCPALLVVNTQSADSANIMSGFFEYCRKH